MKRTCSTGCLVLLGAVLGAGCDDAGVDAALAAARRVHNSGHAPAPHELRVMSFNVCRPTTGPSWPQWASDRARYPCLTLQLPAVRNLLMAWVLTLPASIGLARLLFWAFSRCFESEAQRAV